MAQKPHPKPAVCPLCAILPIAGLLALIAGLACLTAAIHVSRQGVPAYAAASPGELVDAAMSLPGAIVLSPHRDLDEIGFDMPDNARVGSPSIAIETKRGFCVWELGNDYLIKMDGSSMAFGGTLYHHGDEFVSSYIGYQAAYDRFTACVDVGSAPKPPIAEEAFESAVRKYGYTYTKSDEKSDICIDGKWFKILHVDERHLTAELDGPLIAPFDRVGATLSKPCNTPLSLTTTAKPSNLFRTATGWTDNCEDASNPGAACGPAPEAQ